MVLNGMTSCRQQHDAGKRHCIGLCRVERWRLARTSKYPAGMTGNVSGDWKREADATIYSTVLDQAND